MKTASVRDLRNNYSRLLDWLSAGEEILITQRGKKIARLIPESSSSPQTVDWGRSPAILRDRSGEKVLSAEESAELLEQSRGRW